MKLGIAHNVLVGLCLGSTALFTACSSDTGEGVVAGGGSASSGVGASPGDQVNVAGGGQVNAPTMGVGGAANGAIEPGMNSTAGSTNGVAEQPTVAPDVVVNESGGEVDCSTITRPPTPLRRLTRYEYNNTVRDLFNTSLTPADEFPRDEKADGYFNNALVLTVASLHAEKYMEAAEALAAEAMTHIDDFLPCDAVTAGEEACAEQFATTFGRRVYRRPLDADEVEALMGVYAVADSFEKGVEVMIRAMLQSPQFLFRIEFTGSENPGAGMMRLNSYETATRLSYLIWGSGPDEAVLNAAESGQLETSEQVGAMARQMMADPKARIAIGEFFQQWLGYSEIGENVSKSAVSFPEWTPEVEAALKAELQAVVGELVWGSDTSLQAALTKPLGLPTGPLADLYGVAASESVLELPQEERVGLLTLPGFMAVQAHPDQTSPVLRGKFIRAKLLCTPPPPPPENAMISPPEPSEGGTARERFSAHLTEDSCAACHALMDPLGFALENYDAMGRYRTTDNGQEMDLSGEMVSTLDMNGPFNGPRELSEKLAGSEQVRDCVARQWFKFAMGRGAEDGDVCSLAPLQDNFAASGSNLMELIVNTTQTEAFLYRRAVTEVAQ